jgi:hypothetical protein
MSLVSSIKKVGSNIALAFKDGTSESIGVASQKIDVSSSGSFSAAQPTLRISRIGKQVTLIFPSLAHSSSSAPASAAGIIPAGYRPPHTVTNMYTGVTASVNIVAVGATGTLSFEYRDWNGSLVARTDTQVGTLTWNVE